MDTLSTELVEYILGSNNLDIEDIINVSSTCKYLQNVVNSSNYIWKSVYYKRLPHFKSIIKRPDVDYISEVKYVYGLRRRIRNMLETMPPRFYRNIMINYNDLIEWEELCAEGEITYIYVVDYLRSFIIVKSNINSIECVPLLTPGNWTLRFFCLKVLEYLKQMKVVEYYKELISLPEKCQLAEKAAMIIAQWCQPSENIEYADICKCLDDLAKHATEELRHVNPRHPLFSVPKETLEKWKTENFYEPQFSNGNHNLQIVQAIQTAMYTKEKFSGNDTYYYKFENSYIDKVLQRKCGLPIVLSIIYESVARRMGVNCEPINTPAHFLLRFKPDANDNTVYFIDAFNGGKMFPKGVCPHSQNSPGIVPRANIHQILTRMAANLELSLQWDEIIENDLNFVRVILELGILIDSKDYAKMANLGALYMSLDMDTHRIQDILEPLCTEDNLSYNFLNKMKKYESHRATEVRPQPQTKKRTDRVKFAVGMIMRHKRLSYVGVITGWAAICEESPTWQAKMQVNRLKYKNNQPFYEVHATDMSRRYVAQENVEIIGEIENPYFSDDLGRHFSHFFVNHYVPHSAKEKEYAEDTLIRHNFYQSRLWQK